MTWVAALHFLLDSRVMIFPKSGEVTRNLNGPVIGSEDAQDQWHAPRSDFWSIPLGVDLLDKDVDAGLLRAGVVYPGQFPAISGDALGGVLVQCAGFLVAQPILQRRQGGEVLDLLVGTATIKETLQNQPVVVCREFRDFQIRQDLPQKIETCQPLPGGVVPPVER